jgi:tetratricopeptide (TPR) repeat protein
MRTCQQWLVLIVISLTGLTASAAERQGNPYVKEAVRLFNDLDYDEALRTVEKALQWPSNTQEEHVFLSLLEGVLAFETFQSGRGLTAFRRALALNPKAQPDFPLSPKVAEELEQIRREALSAQASQRAQGGSTQPSPAQETAAHGPSARAALTPAQLRLPVAIGGGLVAVGGVLSWSRAKMLENQIRTADASLSNKTQLESALSQGRTLETLGWVLMGVGAATASGSLLLLDAPSTRTSLTASPAPGGAQVFLHGSLP